jgi:hypothetical protein
MLVNFMTVWSILHAAISYILWLFDIFCGHLGMFFPFRVVPRKIWQPWCRKFMRQIQSTVSKKPFELFPSWKMDSKDSNQVSTFTSLHVLRENRNEEFRTAFFLCSMFTWRKSKSDIQILSERPWPLPQQSVVARVQGDRIGRIFASWAIVYYGHFFENSRSSPKVVGYFFPRLRILLNFSLKRVGLLFGQFFHKLIWSPCQGLRRSFNMLTLSAAFSWGEVAT